MAALNAGNPAVQSSGQPAGPAGLSGWTLSLRGITKAWDGCTIYRILHTCIPPLQPAGRKEIYQPHSLPPNLLDDA
jgi:hypothetical protein